MLLVFGIFFANAGTSQDIISRSFRTVIVRRRIFGRYSYYGRRPYEGLTLEPQTITRISEFPVESVLVDRKRVANLERIITKFVLL